MAKTRIQPIRHHSNFNTTITVVDGGLHKIQVERQKTDRAVVTLLLNKDLRGKRLSPEKIMLRFNRKHPTAHLNINHVLHSLKHIMRDMPGVLTVVNGEYSASARSLAALDRVKYVRMNGK